MNDFVKQFSAVIFDMDGLLLDSERIALKAFQKTCADFKLGERMDLFYKCVGTNEALSESILKEGLEGLADYRDFSTTWSRRYRELVSQKPVPLKPGVNGLLSHLKAFGVTAAVATSTETNQAKSKLTRSGILDYFKLIVGGDQVRCSKPDPEIYLKAAALLSVEPAGCLACEDSENGVWAAVAAGMTVVQVPDLVQPNESLLSLGHIVVERLDKILDDPFHP